VPLLALFTLAGSSGSGFVPPAAAASVPTGMLLKTVSLTSTCPAGGSVVTLVSGRLLGETLSAFPVLLAVGCPNSNVISFVDPNSTNPSTQVVATVTATTTPATPGWSALAVRPNMGDLIGCTNITGSTGVVQTQVYSIPLTAPNMLPPNISVTASLLPLNSGSPITGTCDGLGWDSGDTNAPPTPPGSFYVSPGGTQVLHFSGTGAQLNTIIDPCPTVGTVAGTIGGLAITGSTMFASCNNATLVQISKDGEQLLPTCGGAGAPPPPAPCFSTIPLTSPALAGGVVCDPATFAAAGNSALWAGDVNKNQVYALALPLTLCANVIGGLVMPSGAQCDKNWPGGVADVTSTAGDGLLDCWKVDGIDANGDGIIDFTLPGCPSVCPSKMHHDLYLEIDSYATCPPATGPQLPAPPTCAPSQAIADALTAAFNNAPVPNPDGTTGIHLHVLLGDSTLELNPPSGTTLALNLPPCTPLNADGSEPAGQDFASLKQQFFGTATERADANHQNILAAKSFVYHYMISAPTLAGSGASGCSQLPGQDASIALGTWSFSSADLAPSWEGTIMHELGHNLGLRHGGGPAIDTATNGSKLSANCKPNYLSVMSYAFQMPDRPVPVANWKLDYSRLQLPTLTEGTSTMGLLNETSGVFGTPANQAALTGLVTAFSVPTRTGGRQILVPSASVAINWDADKAAPPGPPNLIFDDANNFGALSGCPGGDSTLSGWDDWKNLIYDFHTSVDFAAGLHDNQEITVAQSQAIVDNTAPHISVVKIPIQQENADLTYAITATNTGTKTAMNMSLTDTLPSGESFVSAKPSSCSQSGGVVTCNVGKLTVGAKFTATIVVNKRSGSLLNQAAVSFDPDNPLFQSNVTCCFSFLAFVGGVSSPPAINLVSSGSVVPVEFNLAGNFGLNVLASTPQSQQVDCAGLPGTVNLKGDPSAVQSPGGGDLDLGIIDNHYQFHWQTDPSWAGTCRVLSLQLNEVANASNNSDGLKSGQAPAVHVAFFKFS
jgi:uncharacterized repeat protein (TIGR01451 family)